MRLFYLRILRDRKCRTCFVATATLFLLLHVSSFQQILEPAAGERIAALPEETANRVSFLETDDEPESQRAGQRSISWIESQEEAEVTPGPEAAGLAERSDLLKRAANILSGAKLLVRSDESVDETVLQALRELEELRQEKYLEKLRLLGRKGSVGHQARIENGVLLSYPNSTLRFPALLKRKDPARWTRRERVWGTISHYPWPDDEVCRTHSIRFSTPHSLPVRGLASFPSSGNTWARYLIEGSTGIYTGSLYNDPAIMNKGMYGESVCFDCGMTIVQKTHGCTTQNNHLWSKAEQIKHNHMEELNCTAILLIRNPLSAIMSHRHLDVGGHFGFAPTSYYVGKGWEDYVSKKVALWRNFYTFWLDRCPQDRLHVVHYEKLKQDTRDELLKMLRFLHVVPDAGRMTCALHHSAGRFKRKVHPDTGNPYTRDLFRQVYEAMVELNRTLTSHHKEPLPLHLYPLLDDLLVLNNEDAT